MKIHSQIKEINCVYPGCKKVFTQKGNMKSHLKTHVRLFTH